MSTTPTCPITPPPSIVTRAARGRQAAETVIAEYAAPKTIDPALAQARMLDILAIAPRILDVPAEHVRTPRPACVRAAARALRQNGAPAGRLGRAMPIFTPSPAAHRGKAAFTFAKSTLMTTWTSGIFLDHRVTPTWCASINRARRFLNLFAYTGTATCYAADGGVGGTVTVDLSNTYLDWAERNMRQNGFVGPQHHFVRDDVLAWIRDQRQTRNRWDLILSTRHRSRTRQDGPPNLGCPA